MERRDFLHMEETAPSSDDLSCLKSIAHRRRKVSNIRGWGRGWLRILGAKGGKHLASWKPTDEPPPLPHTHTHTHTPCKKLQVTVLILKSDNIAKSGIELKGNFLPIHSNNMKCTYIIILPFSLVLLLSTSHCFT